MIGSTPGLAVATLAQAADFQRVLGTPSKARSPHFAVHHVAAGPLPSTWHQRRPLVPQLSTEQALEGPESVDKSLDTVPLTRRWLGLVVPKRHARRAVTRSLVKRQMRAVFADQAVELAAGLWVLRLRSGFETASFPSAASDALRVAVRAELQSVLQRAARR